MFLGGHTGIITQSFREERGAGRDYLENLPPSTLTITSNGNRGEEFLVRPLTPEEATTMVAAGEAKIHRTLSLVFRDCVHRAKKSLGFISASTRPSDAIWEQAGIDKPVAPPKKQQKASVVARTKEPSP